MPPFRPRNLNKRAYPGNANVIGPTRVPSLGITTTTCTSSTLLCCCACVFCPIVVGQRCSCCFCPTVFACCTCSCTVCTPSDNLSGVWKSSEQYDAKINCAWTKQTICSSTSPTLVCCTTGQTCVNVIVDYYGTVFCISGSTKYVKAACTGFGTWDNRNTAVTCAANLGASGEWQVYDFTQGCNLLQPYKSQLSGEYWLNTECDGNRGHTYRGGRIYGSGKTTGRGFVAFRSTNS